MPHTAVLLQKQHQTLDDVLNEQCIRIKQIEVNLYKPQKTQFYLQVQKVVAHLYYTSCLIPAKHYKNGEQSNDNRIAKCVRRDLQKRATNLMDVSIAER